MCQLFALRVKFGRGRSYSFAGFHTVSPGEGIKCTAGLTSGTGKSRCCRQDGTGGGLPGCLWAWSWTKCPRDQAFCLLFPVMATVSCAKRYGYPPPCPFVQQKQKLIKVNVRRLQWGDEWAAEKNRAEKLPGAGWLCRYSALGGVCLAAYACSFQLLG